MTRSTVFILFCAIVLTSIIQWEAHADIPKMISYQAKVTDSGGSPVADGTYDMAFKLFDAETGGTQEWESGTVSITVTDGIFSTLLGKSPQIAILLDFSEDLWLEVIFDDVTQSPRQQMASVGYAYMASGLVPGTQIHATSFGELLHVHNQQSTGEAHGIEVRTHSTGGHAIIGIAEATTGNTRGVFGRAYSSNGRAVIGYNSAVTGNSYGVYGETPSTSGKAVYGWATASTGIAYGVRGRSDASAGVGVYGSAVNSTSVGTKYGGRFVTEGTPSYGVHAEAMSTSGFARGVQGESNSSEGTGVYGYNGALSGDTYGVYGWSSSNDGSGVCGFASSSVGQTAGVTGRTNSSDGYGVHGFNARTTGSGIGVYGYTYSTDGVGVWGEGGGSGSQASGTGVIGRGVLQGGIFHDLDDGNWAACGRSVYKVLGTGMVSFVQNHPLNGNDVIVYAAPEGDEVATYTRGTAQLIDGEARVDLGETFAWVTNPDIGLTAHLTPRGPRALLYVESLDSETMLVRSTEGFADNVVFDYIVYGLRIGFEQHSVIQEKDLEAAIPSMAGQERLYAKRPELRRYNALERFRTMHASMGRDDGTDTPGADRLKDQIGTGDPIQQKNNPRDVSEAYLPLAPGGEMDDQSIKHFNEQRSESDAGATVGMDSQERM